MSVCIPLGLFEFIWLLVVVLVAIFAVGAGGYMLMTGVLGKSKTSGERKHYRPGQPMRRKITWDKQKPT